MNVREEIIKAKMFLNKDANYPFFGYLLFLLKTEELKECPTIGTDGEFLYINSDFLKDKTPKEMRGLLLHEIMHLSLGHLWRRGARNPLLWNIAADIVINNEISKFKNVLLPKGAIIDHKYDGWFVEQIYKDIKKNTKIIKINIGVGKDGFSNDKGNKKSRGSHSDWNKKDKSKAKKNKMQRKWKRAVQQAADVHKMKQRGDLPLGIQRIVEENQPTIDWKEVLLSYISEDNADYSYRRPDRRFLNGDFIMPDLVEGERLEDLVIAVDCSGSIGERELKEFSGEVKGILKSVDSVKAWICSFDTEIYEFKEIDSSQFKLKYYGGGGTDTNPVFDEIKKRKLTPKVLLIFTDGYADYPAKAPDYDVIFLVPKRDHEKPPFGRILYYEGKG